MCEVDEELDSGINDLCDKYKDALHTLIDINVHTREYNIGNNASEDDKAAFLSWCEVNAPLWQHELVMRHGVEM